MGQRNPESFGGLARKRATRGIGNGAGDHDRPAAATSFENLFDRNYRRFGVECVENGFDEQNVGAAVDQAIGCLDIVAYQFVKGDVTGARVIHIGGNGGGARCRADDAGHQARLGRVLCGKFVTGGAGKGGTCNVEFVNDLFQFVIRLGKTCGIEGVGFNDVGTSRQVLLVDALNNFRASQQQ